MLAADGRGEHKRLVWAISARMPCCLLACGDRTAYPVIAQVMHIYFSRGQESWYEKRTMAGALLLSVVHSLNKGVYTLLPHLRPLTW
jgi:hypothetical protein